MNERCRAVQSTHLRETQDRNAERQRDDETGLRGVCEREKMLKGKRSETDGWALEREGLSRIKMGQEEQECLRTSS